MGRQVGNNIMEAYSKLKNLSGRTDGKPETMAKCKTLLALLCSEYDYDVINVSKMNAQVVIKYYTCISFYLHKYTYIFSFWYIANKILGVFLITK